jgi:hypothetical protein
MLVQSIINVLLLLGVVNNSRQISSIRRRDRFVWQEDDIIALVAIGVLTQEQADVLISNLQRQEKAVDNNRARIMAAFTPTPDAAGLTVLAQKQEKAEATKLLKDALKYLQNESSEFHKWMVEKDHSVETPTNAEGQKEVLARFLEFQMMTEEKKAEKKDEKKDEKKAA